jgi:hypothetical protein
MLGKRLTGFGCLALLLAGNGCSQENHAVGFVVGDDGVPVPAAKVQLFCGDADEPREAGCTDNDGRFDLGFQSDKGHSQTGDLIVTKAGFVDYASKYRAGAAASPVKVILFHAYSEALP